MNSVNKLLEALSHTKKLHFDKWSEQKAYRGIGETGKRKKWISNIVPYELLTRNIKKAVESVMTLSEGEIYDYFPDNIETPDYGDNWGRFANYIEINNRSIAKMEGNRCKDGTLSLIKMLPAIPPSAKSWASCIMVSHIFPIMYGDGYNKPVWEENSAYTMKLNAGYSDNLIVRDIEDKISDKEQLKAFCDLAHFRGIKTGFRVLISEDQIKVARKDRDDENFRWYNDEHVQMFINACVEVINLGFEAIFVDSAKHIGGYDCPNYTGVGRLPYYHQMQYITDEIRKRSHNPHVSIVGEKSSFDFDRYKNMGLSAGTAIINAEREDEVRYWSEKLKYYRQYAPGPEVSNDNDTGGRSYEDRLKRMHSCLFGFECASDKLPSFMQMEDLFPLRYDTNTHLLMMTNPNYSLDNTPESHWEWLFAKDDGKYYNSLTGQQFAWAVGL